MTLFGRTSPTASGCWRAIEPRSASGDRRPPRATRCQARARRGSAAIDGVVDFVSRSIIGIRTDDALYRFAHSPQGAAFLGHHIYRDDIDREATRAAWQSWLDRTLA